MILNRELIMSKCREIEECIERLERVTEKSKDDFLKEQDLKDIASYRLMIAIEAALALCYHVAAKQLRKVPTEYAECFVVLADAGIITPDLSGRLQKMARFRNLLVHMYWKLDYTILYDIIENNLGDLREFMRAIASLEIESHNRTLNKSKELT
ncbi:MAG: DUF86 domain-containing protein [Proteobacteria bacterium]|nr:DUF86 domain-containing protein [Pseudomonadota bacterium]